MDDSSESSVHSSSVSQSSYSFSYRTPSQSSCGISREDSPSTSNGSSSYRTANISSDDDNDEDDDSFIIDDDDSTATSDGERTSESTEESSDNSSFPKIAETMPFDKTSNNRFKTFLTEFPTQYSQSNEIPLAAPITAPALASMPQPSPELALLEATKLGDLNRVKEIIRSGIDTNAIDKDGRSALHIACSLGHIEIVKYLIEHGGNVDAFSLKNKQTPLHETCIGGHTKILQLLLLEVADLDVVDHLGRSAAHYCAIHGEESCLEILCSQGCDVCLEDTMSRTGVHFAAMNNHCGIIQILMERGADLDVMDNEGKTPVHYAVRYGRVAALQALLKNAVDINQGDTMGSLPSHEAAFHNQLHCLKILLKKGVKTSSQDDKGRNIVHKAAQGKSLDCLHWILSSGRVDVNCKDYSDNTALHYAATNGFSEGYYCLIQHGAVSDGMLDSEGKSPLDLARKYGKYNAIMKAVDGKSMCVMCCANNTDAQSKQQRKQMTTPTCTEEVKNALFKVPDSVRTSAHGRENSRHIKDIRGGKTSRPSKKLSQLSAGIGEVEANSHFTLAAKYYGPPL